jgi:tight adherence protein B
MTTGAVCALLAVLAAGGAAWAMPGPDHGGRLRRAQGHRSGRRLPRVRRIPRVVRPARDAEAWRRASIELCQSLGAELATGRPPGEALARAVEVVRCPDDLVLRPVAIAARSGGDVAEALRAAAPRHGGDGLRRLAGCWQVAVHAGGGLAALADGVSNELRAARTHRQDIAAQLAGARATARLLACLPLLGSLLAAVLGMRPFAFLLGDPLGLACLLLGVTLDLAGLWWIKSMVRRAEEPC